MSLAMTVEVGEGSSDQELKSEIESAYGRVDPTVPDFENDALLSSGTFGMC